VPIPLGKKRLRERGYNQVEETVRSALTLLEKERAYILDPTLLTRVRETPTQVGLPRAQREINMRGAFAVTRPPDSSCTYLLIDDVITTGATLQSAFDTLIHAGARDASLIALAH
jgi:predicted amidophosphoribosyltransferase